jgi:hypothetical protein
LSLLPPPSSLLPPPSSLLPPLKQMLQPHLKHRLISSLNVCYTLFLDVFMKTETEYEKRIFQLEDMFVKETLVDLYNK